MLAERDQRLDLLQTPFALDPSPFGVAGDGHTPPLPLTLTDALALGGKPQRAQSRSEVLVATRLRTRSV